MSNNDKTFTIRLPDETYEELRELAEERNTTVADLIRKSIRLSMIVLADNPDGPVLMVKQGDELRQVVLF